MKVGVSLSPNILLGSPTLLGEQKLLQAFGDPPTLLQTLKERGVTSIELRCVDEAQDPEQMRPVYEMLWEAGFKLSVHGRIEESNDKGKHLAQVFPPMSYILEHFATYQGALVINLHAFSSDDVRGESVQQLSERTATALSHWSEMAENEDLNVYFALELNRKKPGKQDPGDTIQGVLDVLEKVDSSRVGIGWDMGHYYSDLLKGIDLSASSLPPATFLMRTIHTHIHGLSETGNTHFPVLSEQDLPLKKYVQELQKIGYKGIYNLELDYDRYADDPELVNKSLQSIDQLISCIE